MAACWTGAKCAFQKPPRASAESVINHFVVDAKCAKEKTTQVVVIPGYKRGCTVIGIEIKIGSRL